jgi:hypothetical protein
MWNFFFDTVQGVKIAVMKLVRWMLIPGSHGYIWCGIKNKDVLVSQDGALVEVERGIVSQVPFVCPFFYSEVGVHRVLAFRLYAVHCFAS